MYWCEQDWFSQKTAIEAPSAVGSEHCAITIQYKNTFSNNIKYFDFWIISIWYAFTGIDIYIWICQTNQCLLSAPGTSVYLVNLIGQKKWLDQGGTNNQIFHSAESVYWCVCLSACVSVCVCMSVCLPPPQKPGPLGTLWIPWAFRHLLSNLDL